MTAGERLPLTIIAAVARNGVIGSANALPWRLPSDMRHFKAATMHRPVLMGRRTFESIKAPLSGRRVIVLSQDPSYAAPGALTASTLEGGLALAEDAGRQMGSPDVIVAGGGMLYAALIGRAARLSITAVDLAPEGDTRFPAIDPTLWRETARIAPPRTERDEAAFAFVTYERRRDAAPVL